MSFFPRNELLGARIEWWGTHRGIRWLVGCTTREPSPHMEYDKAWATYVLLTPQQHDKLKSIIKDAPWNCGQTYYREHSVKHIDAPDELRGKYDGSYFKIGDDFQHYWDDGRHDLYDLEHMKTHIKEIIDYFMDSKAMEDTE